MGIDPKTSIIFASMLFSGSMSDNEDYWQYILEEDGVMADKGFKIEKKYRQIGIKAKYFTYCPCF